MAIKAFPLNQTDYSYNAQDVMKYYAGRHSGVLGLGDNCRVSMAEGMALTVTKGRGWLSHGTDYCTAFWMEEDVTLTLSNGDANNPRWDYVCVGWTIGELKNAPTVYIKKGTPATNPVEPSLENSATKVEICLAKVYVPAGASVDTGVNVGVYDTRADRAYCGIVGVDPRVDDLKSRLDSLENRGKSLDTRIDSCQVKEKNINNRIYNLDNGVTSAGKATQFHDGNFINGAFSHGNEDIETSRWGVERKFTVDGNVSYLGVNDVDIKTIQVNHLSFATNMVVDGCSKVGEKKLYVVNDGRKNKFNITVKATSIKQIVLVSWAKVEVQTETSFWTEIWDINKTLIIDANGSDVTINYPDYSSYCKDTHFVMVFGVE